MRVFSAAGMAALVFGLALIGAGAATAGDKVLRGAAPAWVVAMEAPAETSNAAAEDGLRVLLFDTQYRAESDLHAYYIRTRSAALSPQGLAALGNVTLTWNPETEDVTVHQVNIVRGDEVIDVLAAQAFETLRREENLEQAMLDGRLTAVLQPSGLRTGDIIDVAYTVTSRDPIPGFQAEQAIDLNPPVVVDRMHFKASWPTAMPVRTRARDDWATLPVRRADGYSSVEIRRDDVQPVLVPVDAPGRFQRLNMVEISGYRDWSDVAATMKPLYDRARRLEPNSPLHAEIARIRALSDDPSIQAAAALRLVQDEVRYVALLMGEGALTPATADETWSRRFGDCKGKTALLLALLDGLGIQADPAAVSLLEGDGLDQRLPMIGAFDHVLVRAVVADTVHWLDGTGSGDRRLEQITVPPFHWALPIVASGARLEALRVEPRAEPESEIVIALDSSAGLHAPVQVEGTMLMRGQGASVLAGQLGMVAGSQKDQLLRATWMGMLSQPTITEVASSYDAEASTLALTMKGTMKLDWPAEGLVIPGSTYAPISTQKRPEGPFLTTPYAVNHPVFARQVSTLRLPEGGRGFRVSGGRFDRTELGHRMSRTVELEGDLVTVQTSVRSLVGEITAAEADAARAAAATRPRDVPLVFSPANYQLSDADREAWTAEAPTTEGAWLDRALALFQSRDFAGAVAAAEKAIELAPESSAAWANRGVYRFWTNDRAGAAEDLNKAVDLDPSERIAMNGNALLAMSEGRHDDAVVEISRALRQAPKDPFALGLRIQAYMALNQPDRALRDIDALTEIQPDDVTLKLMRIGALEQAGRLEEADAAMTTLAQASPTDRRILVNHAALKLERGQAKDASDILDGVISEHPADTSALVLRATASIALGQPDLAERDFAVVRAANPDNAQVLNNLCWTAATAGALLDQALRDCDAALALEPDSPPILDSRGRVLLQMGDAAGALTAYEAALAKAPDLANSLYGRGLARIALGSVAEGEADKAAATKTAPEVVESFTAYSRGDGQLTR